MKTSPSITTLDPAQAVRRVPRPSLLQKAVLKGFEAIEAGHLTVVVEERRHEFGRSMDEAVDAVLEVHDDRFWSALALRGSVGAGEAYAYGWWTSPEPTDVVRVLVANQRALDGMEKGLARRSLPIAPAGRRRLQPHVPVGSDVQCFI